MHGLFAPAVRLPLQVDISLQYRISGTNDSSGTIKQTSGSKADIKQRNSRWEVNHYQLPTVISINHINMRLITFALATLFASTYAKTFDVSTRTTLANKRHFISITDFQKLNSKCYPGTNGDRYCCVKNHHTCEKQVGEVVLCFLRKLLTAAQRGGGIGVCYSDATVYCGGCGADCCTYDPNAPTYEDDSESGSRYTSSSTLYGTYCKS